MTTFTDIIELAPDAWKSLYLPIVPTDLMLDGIHINSEETLKDVIENKLYLGKVNRIDFIKKTNETTKQTKQSAFIHFDQWFEKSRLLRKYLEEHEEYKLTGGFYDANFRSKRETFVSSRNPRQTRFITMKINKTPIATLQVEEIPLNVHQLVHNNGMMEKLIEEQKLEIETLKQQIAKLMKPTEELEILHEIGWPHLIPTIKYIVRYPCNDNQPERHGIFVSFTDDGLLFKFDDDEEIIYNDEIPLIKFYVKINESQIQSTEPETQSEIVDLTV